MNSFSELFESKSDTFIIDIDPDVIGINSMDLETNLRRKGFAVNIKNGMGYVMVKNKDKKKMINFLVKLYNSSKDDVLSEFPELI